MVHIVIIFEVIKIWHCHSFPLLRKISFSGSYFLSHLYSS